MNSPAGHHHHHRAFGLTIRSCLPLPELLPVCDPTSADIEVAFGDVPVELPGAVVRGVRYEAAPDRLLLRVDEVARYLVNDGWRVTIEREPGGEDADVRAFLLGPVMGAILHQRDDLVLHGSAIEVEGEGVAFLGISGVGKSTLASAFRQRGYAVLTDDLCVVRTRSDGRMVIHPSFPHAKLWLDSLKQLSVPAAGLRRVRTKIEKRIVPLEGSFATEALPVRKLYLLVAANSGELSLKTVEGPRKFNLLKNHTYRFGFLAGVSDKTGHFQQTLKLAQQVPVSIARRPESPFRLDDLVALIESDLRT